MAGVARHDAVAIVNDMKTTTTTGPLTYNEKIAAKAHTDRLIAAWEAAFAAAKRRPGPPPWTRCSRSSKRSS